MAENIITFYDVMRILWIQVVNLQHMENIVSTPMYIKPWKNR